jgi:hypothetical protein
MCNSADDCYLPPALSATTASKAEAAGDEELRGAAFMPRSSWSPLSLRAWLMRLRH